MPPTEMSMPAPPAHDHERLPKRDKRQNGRELQHGRHGRQGQRRGLQNREAGDDHEPKQAENRKDRRDARRHRVSPGDAAPNADGYRRSSSSRPDRASAPSTSNSRRPVTTGCHSDGTPARSSPF